MSNLLLTRVGLGSPGGAVALTAGSYQATGTNTGAPTSAGGWTTTSNFTDGNEADTSTGVAPSSGNVLSCLTIKSVAGAPAQVYLTVNYDGTLTLTFFGWNGSSWVALTDNSGTTFSPHVGTASESKVCTFADGSTTYSAYRVVASATTLTSVTDVRWYTTFVPSLTTGLDAHWTAVRDTYSDTACTTPVVADAAAVGGWKDLSGTAWKAIQGTGANQPIIKRNVSGFGTHALQFSDDPTTPTAYYWLDTTNYLTSRFNTSHTVYIVASRPAAQTNDGYLFTRVSNPAWGIKSTGTAVTAATQFAYGSTVSNPSAYSGVFGCSYDGVNGVAFFNDQQIADPSTASVGFGTNNMRLGNYDGTSTYSWKGYIFEVLVYTAAHTETQKRTIVAELQAFYGQVTVESWLIEGNSISAGFGTYTDPFKNHINDYLAPDVGLTLRATAGHTTQQRATDTIANAWTYGNSYPTDEFTSTGTPTQTTIQASGSPGWTTDQWAGYYVVMTSGSDGVKGMGGIIASNTSDTLTLTTSSIIAGFPTAPTSGNKFKIFTPGKQLSTLVCLPWETTNDLTNNGATLGPAAVSGSRTACTVYQNMVSWCIACKALGFKVIVPTILDRDTTPYANFQADITTMNGWIRTDYASYGDALYDTYIDSRSATCDFPAPATYFIDETHPSNTLSPILAEDIAAVGAAL